MNESWIIIYKCCVPGLGWTYPCDLWSVGCILVELCSVCDICHIVARAKLKLHCLLLTSAHCLSHSKVTCTFFHINFRVLLIIWHWFGREMPCFRHMRTWSIWRWWSECLGPFLNTWSKGQSMYLSVWCSWIFCNWYQGTYHVWKSDVSFLCWIAAGILKSMSDMDVSWIGQRGQSQKTVFELCADYLDYGYVVL